MYLILFDDHSLCEFAWTFEEIGLLSDNENVCLLFTFDFVQSLLHELTNKSKWTLYRKSRWWKTLQIRTCALGRMTETRGESFYQQLEFDNLTRGKTLLLNIEWFWETLWTNFSLLGCQISWKSIFQSSSDTQFLHRIIRSLFFDYERFFRMLRLISD